MSSPRTKVSQGSESQRPDQPDILWNPEEYHSILSEHMLALIDVAFVLLWLCFLLTRRESLSWLLFLARNIGADAFGRMEQCFGRH